MGVVRERMLEAGAGAGKTTSLVRMILDNVKNKEADLNEIVAITFTEAATSELKERFQKKYIEEYTKLEKSTVRTADEERTYQILKKSIDKLDSIGISTIHGFCNNLLKESPFDLGYGIDRNVVTDKEEENFYKFLYYSAVEEVCEDVELISLFGLNIKDLYYTFLNIFKIRNINWHVNNDKAIRDNITSVIKSDIELYNSVYKLLTNLLKNFTKEEISIVLKSDAGKFLSSGPLNESMTHKDFSFLTCLLKKNDNKFVNNFDLFFSKKIGATEEVKQILKKAKNIYENNIEEIEFLANEVIIKSKEYNELTLSVSEIFLKNVYEKAWRLKKESNTITNDDILYDALTLLKKINSGEVKKELNYKFCYIDEFQDTDPSQTEIFKTLGEIVKKSPNGNLTFFYIGDPKQSIYRFRGADLDCYLNTKKTIELKKKDDGLNYSIDILPKNYRSNKSVLDFVNNFFCKDNFFGDFKYIPMEVGRKDEGDVYKSKPNDVLNGVFTYDIIDSSATKGREHDAEYIATLIDTLVKSNVKIHSRGEDGTRQVKYNDFLIITPNTKSHGFYINALHKKGIGVNFQGKMEYSDCASNFFYGAILYITGDKNYAESYILELTYRKGIENITKSEREGAEFILGFISKYSNKSPLSFINNFDTLMFDISNHFHLDLDLSVLYQIFEELKEQSIPTFKDLRSSFESIINGNLERQLSLSSSADEVRLMNLHKSKGLQGNIVILADPPTKCKKFKRHVGELNGSWYFELAKKNELSGQDSVIVANDKINDIQLIEEEKDNEEYNRLLYVAATRAEEVLLISSYHNISKSKKDNTETIKVQNSSYWYPLFAYFNDGESEEKTNDFNTLFPNINKEFQKNKLQESEIDTHFTTVNDTNNSILDNSTQNNGGNFDNTRITKFFVNYTTKDNIKHLQTFKRTLIKPSKSDEKYLLDKRDDNYDGVDNINSDTSLNNFLELTESVENATIQLSPTTRGTIIHVMFECIVNFILQSKKENRTRLLSSNALRSRIIKYAIEDTLMSLNVSPYAIDTIYSNYQKEFDDILISFLNNSIQNEIDSATQVYTEYPFEYVSKRTDNSEEVTKGIIDLLLVYEDKDGSKTYQIYDYKTNTKNLEESIDDFEKRLYKDYKSQIALYEKAIRDIESQKENGGSKYIIKPTKVYHLY